jgi:hypothetical protein
MQVPVVRPTTPGPIYSDISSVKSDSLQTPNLDLPVAEWNFTELSFPELDFLEVEEDLPPTVPQRSLDTPPILLSSEPVNKGKPVEDIPIDLSVVKPISSDDSVSPTRDSPVSQPLTSSVTSPPTSTVGVTSQLMEDFPEIRLPAPFTSLEQLSSNPYFFFIGAPSHYLNNSTAQLLRASRVSAREFYASYERRFVPEGFSSICKEESVSFPDGRTYRLIDTWNKAPRTLNAVNASTQTDALPVACDLPLDLSGKR